MEMKDIITAILSGLALVVSTFSWVASRRAEKTAIRVGLYDRRKAIWDACHDAITAAMWSLILVKPEPISSSRGGKQIMSDLAEATWESERILPNVYPDILKLKETVQRIDQLQMMASSTLYEGAGPEEIRQHEENKNGYRNALKEIKNVFYIDYAIDGLFATKVKEAITIRE